MLKPFILDISSLAYKKQFEHCKMKQALLGTSRSSHDPFPSGSHAQDPSFPPSHPHFQQANSLPSHHYSPIPSFLQIVFVTTKSLQFSVSIAASRATGPPSVLLCSQVSLKGPSSSLGSSTISILWKESIYDYI